MIRSALIIITAVTLTACNPEEALDTLDAQMCTSRGEKARDVFRTLRDDDFRAGDRAVCVRCPGEIELTCTGDPKALPGG